MSVIRCQVWLALLLSLAGSAAPKYTLTDLGALTGYPNSRAYAINNKGQVVGQVAKVEPTIEVHAVLWEGVDGLPIDLNDCIPAGTGLILMKAVAINDAGQIAGEARDANMGIHAVLLTPVKE